MGRNTHGALKILRTICYSLSGQALTNKECIVQNNYRKNHVCLELGLV